MSDILDKRLVDLALATRAIRLRVAALEAMGGPSGPASSGWGFYKHNGAAQAIVADTDTALINDQGTKIETHKPADVTTFFAANKITGRDGDALLAQIDFAFTPSSALASMLQIWIDIGGGFPPAFKRLFPITLGNGIAHAISMTIAPYTLNTWQANGGAIMVRADGPGSISGQTIVVTRTHKAL